MLDSAAHWQDAGEFWTERPAWLSNEDTSPDASSLGVVALDATIRTDALIALNPVTVGFVAQEPDVSVLTVVAADLLPMIGFVKDFGLFLESTVLADAVGIWATAQEADSGYIVPADVPFVPLSVVPRDPYVFSEVILTPGVIPLSMATVDDHLYGVLQVIQADALALSVVGEFYYFEITSSLPLDFLSSAMSVPDVTVVCDSLVEADPLEFAATLYDAPPVSNCLVPADLLTLAVESFEPGSQWDSLFEAPELALSAAFAAPTQRTSFVSLQEETLAVAVALADHGVAVDVSASPSLLPLTAAGVLDFDVIASSNVAADILEIGTAVPAIGTARSEGFEQDAPLSIGTTLFGTTYAGRLAFEGAILATQVTRSLTISTPVNLVQDFEGVQ